tara:strand:+ start:13 stop:975 length:963 start_codon:yes stop_codon:yes gene_type:complete
MKIKNSTIRAIYNLKSPALLRSIFDLLIRSTKKFAKDDGSYLAAGMSYYIFFSVFPFLLGLLAFLGIFFGSDKATEQVKDVLERQLPGIADSPIIYDNLQSIDFNKGLVGAIAVIGLLWTGSAVFGSLTRMMNKIWDIEDKRTFYNRKGTDMLFTILIGLVLSTNIFINTIYSQLGQFFGLVGAGSEEVNWIENVWNFITVNILPPLLSIGVFTFIYNVIPQRKIIFRRTLPAAIIGALVFESAKSIFVFYIHTYGNFDMVYGSISAVIILLLFAYVSSIIVVFFAEIHNVFSAMKDEGRFCIREELTLVKGGLKPIKAR